MDVTLEQYLRAEFERSGTLDHRLRATVRADGSVTFFIHPDQQNGDIRDYVVRGNRLDADPGVLRIDS
jgi:hypothetical protein